MRGTARYAPTAPVARGGNQRAPGRPVDEVLSAVVGTNSDLIERVCSLWVAEGEVVADVTYGQGAFWRWTTALPHHRFDLASGTDMRTLPLAAESVDVLVMDPPYRPTHGSRIENRKGGEMFDRFGLGTASLDSIDDVLSLYEAGLREAHRVLRRRGRVFVKCQDMSYQSKLHLASLDVLERMRRVGFELSDQFVLVNETRIARTPQRQRAARRAHSILWVGTKIG